MNKVCFFMNPLPKLRYLIPNTLVKFQLNCINPEHFSSNAVIELKLKSTLFQTDYPTQVCKLKAPIKCLGDWKQVIRYCWNIFAAQKYCICHSSVFCRIFINFSSLFLCKNWFCAAKHCRLPYFSPFNSTFIGHCQVDTCTHITNPEILRTNSKFIIVGHGCNFRLSISSIALLVANFACSFLLLSFKFYFGPLAFYDPPFSAFIHCPLNSPTNKAV